MISNDAYKRLEEHLPFQIDYTANFNKSFRREHQAQFISTELTADELAILFILKFEPDVTQSELAKFLFKGKAHVGKILNEMETRGYIKRTAATKDNIIIKRNEITPKGMEIFEKGYKESLKIKAKMDEEFSQEDIEQFITYLKRFRKVLNSIVDVKLK
ncbi:MAG: MarR family transcriptional regulator [Candidatus Gastranaerophilales bacterium]|nr:MarR family transcriptional regulator [Candidatus Gastranaerophilales bacterium]